MERTRPATPADLPRLAVLARALHDELAAMRGGRLWAAREAHPEPLEAAYASLLEQPDALLVLGLIDDVPVGFAAVELETLRTGDRLGVITDLFVEAPARAVGVGDALAAALVAFCVERGCCGMDATALPGHRAAKSFFEGHGFTARTIVMHRDLRPPP